MIEHIVMWKFADNAEGVSREENIRKVAAMLYALPSRLPFIRGMKIKQNSNDNGTNFDAVLLCEFDSLADVAAYRVHPEHVKVSQFVAKVTTARACVDYEI